MHTSLKYSSIEFGTAPDGYNLFSSPMHPVEEKFVGSGRGTKIVRYGPQTRLTRKIGTPDPSYAKDSGGAYLTLSFGKPPVSHAISRYLSLARSPGAPISRVKCVGGIYLPWAVISSRISRRGSTELPGGSGRVTDLSRKICPLFYLTPGGFHGPWGGSAGRRAEPRSAARARAGARPADAPFARGGLNKMFRKLGNPWGRLVFFPRILEREKNLPWLKNLPWVRKSMVSR